jgi:hypothetical protein
MDYRPLWNRTWASLLFSDDSSGSERLEEGIRRVARPNAEFVRILRAEAKRISRCEGRVCSDDLRIYAKEIGLEPTSPNAWGVIFRGNGWRVVGHVKSSIPSNHRREIKMWFHEDSLDKSWVE